MRADFGRRRKPTRSDWKRTNETDRRRESGKSKRFSSSNDFLENVISKQGLEKKLKNFRLTLKERERERETGRDRERVRSKLERLNKLYVCCDCSLECSDRSLVCKEKNRLNQNKADIRFCIFYSIEKMSQEQRESMIVGVFKFAYFGHVSVGYGIW